MARKESWEWQDQEWWNDRLAQVLSTKPAEVVQKACQVLEEHGCSVKKLKSELVMWGSGRRGLTFWFLLHVSNS